MTGFVTRLPIAAASADAPPVRRHRPSFAGAVQAAATVRRPAPAGVALRERQQPARANKTANRNRPASAFARAAGRPDVAQAASAPTRSAAGSDRQAWIRRLWLPVP